MTEFGKVDINYYTYMYNMNKLCKCYAKLDCAIQRNSIQLYVLNVDYCIHVKTV